MLYQPNSSEENPFKVHSQDVLSHGFGSLNSTSTASGDLLGLSFGSVNAASNVNIPAASASCQQGKTLEDELLSTRQSWKFGGGRSQVSNCNNVSIPSSQHTEYHGALGVQAQSQRASGTATPGFGLRRAPTFNGCLEGSSSSLDPWIPNRSRESSPQRRDLATARDKELARLEETCRELERMNAEKLRTAEDQLKGVETRCACLEKEWTESRESMYQAKVKATSMCTSLEWQMQRLLEISGELECACPRQSEKLEADRVSQAKVAALAMATSMEEQLLSISASCAVSVLAQDSTKPEVAPLIPREGNTRWKPNHVTTNGELQSQNTLMGFDLSSDFMHSLSNHVNSSLSTLHSKLCTETEKDLLLSRLRSERASQEKTNQEFRDEAREALDLVRIKESELRSTEDIIKLEESINEKLLSHTEAQAATYKQRERQLLDEVAADRQKAQCLYSELVQSQGPACPQLLGPLRLISPRPSRDSLETASERLVADLQSQVSELGEWRLQARAAEVAASRLEQKLKGSESALESKAEALSQYQCENRAQNSELGTLRDNVKFLDAEVQATRQDLRNAVRDLRTSEEKMYVERQNSNRTVERLKGQLQQAIEKESELRAKMRDDTVKRESWRRSDAVRHKKEVRKVEETSEQLEEVVDDQQRQLEALRKENAGYLQALREVQSEVLRQRREVQKLRAALSESGLHQHLSDMTLPPSEPSAESKSTRSHTSSKTMSSQRGELTQDWLRQAQSQGPQSGSTTPRRGSESRQTSDHNAAGRACRSSSRGTQRHSPRLQHSTCQSPHMGDDAGLQALANAAAGIAALASSTLGRPDPVRRDLQVQGTRRPVAPRQSSSEVPASTPRVDVCNIPSGIVQRSIKNFEHAEDVEALLKMQGQSDPFNGTLAGDWQASERSSRESSLSRVQSGAPSLDRTPPRGGSWSRAASPPAAVENQVSAEGDSEKREIPPVLRELPKGVLLWSPDCGKCSEPPPLWSPNCGKDHQAT